MYIRRYWQNRQPVLTKLPTGIGQIANWYWRIWQYIHKNQYQLAIWSILVGVFANTGWRFCPISVKVHFPRFGQVEVKIGVGSLRIMPRYGIKNKKKSILPTEMYIVRLSLTKKLEKNYQNYLIQKSINCFFFSQFDYFDPLAYCLDAYYI